MSLPTPLRCLRAAIEEAEAAASESELDHRTHGPNAKKNRLTLQTRLRFIDAANHMTDLLRLSREAVAMDPTPANTKALARAEADINRFIARFDHSFDPPTGDDHDHAIH